MKILRSSVFFLLSKNIYIHLKQSEWLLNDLNVGGIP